MQGGLGGEGERKHRTKEPGAEWGMTPICLSLWLMSFITGTWLAGTPLQDAGRPRQEQLKINADGRATLEDTGNLISGGPRLTHLSQRPEPWKASPA